MTQRWMIENWLGDQDTYVIDADTDELIAKFYVSPGVDAQANARMFVAAPDLLTALENLVNIVTHPAATKEGMRLIAREARAAIAKAKGE